MKTREELEVMMRDRRYRGYDFERSAAFIQEVRDGWKALYPGQIPTCNIGFGDGRNPR